MKRWMVDLHSQNNTWDTGPVFAPQPRVYVANVRRSNLRYRNYALSREREICIKVVVVVDSKVKVVYV